MVNNGWSLANGSLHDGAPRPGRSAIPPVQGGMVPAALPARSAPIGVRLERSAAACSDETAAFAGGPGTSHSSGTIAIAIAQRIASSQPCVAGSQDTRKRDRDDPALAANAAPRRRLRRPSCRSALLLGCGGLAGCIAAGSVVRQARGASLGTIDGFDVRLDTTLRLSSAVRVEPHNPSLLGDINADDGDRAFSTGPISERVDVASQLDITRGDLGAELSMDG